MGSIITRYLSKEVASTTVAVITILTVVIMGGWLIRYFGMAAQGRMDVSILFELTAYRLPEFMALIFPLGFFIALMLVFGRLYAESEMTVFKASGISRRMLGVRLLPLTALCLLIQMLIMMWVAPAGNRAFDRIAMTQAIRSGFDLIRPREFVSSGRYTIYARALAEDQHSLHDIYFYQKGKNPADPDIMILAKSARRIATTDGSSVIDLQQGQRYSLLPGQPKYNHAQFEYYRLRLEPQQDNELAPQRVQAMTMRQLWQGMNAEVTRAVAPVQSAGLQAKVIESELGWRLFGGWVIVLALMLALPLSQVSPRQGRYHRLFPALLIFASLVVALISVKTRISKGSLGWWAYPLVLMLYLVLARWLARPVRLKARLGRASS